MACPAELDLDFSSRCDRCQSATAAKTEFRCLRQITSPVIANEIGVRISRVSCEQAAWNKNVKSCTIHLDADGAGQRKLRTRPRGVVASYRHAKNDGAPEANNLLSVDRCEQGRRIRATLDCLRFDAACVLKNAFGAGVMNEVFAANQALSHEHLAPGAEAIG